MNSRLLKLITGTFIAVFLFLLSANITFAQTSSCQHISGEGPLNIVFIKDESLTSFDNVNFPNPLYVFSNAIDNAINGFKTIEPFKTYFDNFSFYYVDKTYSYETLSSEGMDILSSVISRSACGSDVFEYIWLVENTGKGSYTIRNSNNIFVSIAQADPFATNDYPRIEGYLWREGFPDDFASNLAIGRVVIHETAHAKFGLSDEYMIPPPYFFYVGGTNCSQHPSVDYKSTIDDKWYGPYGFKNVIKGCSSQSFFRPSQNSIMREAWAVPEFNVISCGYLVAGLNGELVDKSNAEKKWPECCKMSGVIKDGVTGCGDTPTITFPPSPENCLLTDFTNQVTEVATSSDSAMIITAQQDIILPRTEQEGFFKINGTDVSKPDGSGGKIVPSGEQLALIPPGGALNIEMSDIYCREEEIELQAEVEPINTKSPIKSVFDQSVQADCTNGSTTTSCLMATSSLSIDIPAQRNCIADSFLATTTQASSSEDILISAEDDILLDNLTAEGDFNFFKINGTDVSVPDENGGRKIPKGDLITIPAGMEVSYETGDKYCREGEFSLSLTQVPVTLDRPISCFFNCK